MNSIPPPIGFRSYPCIFCAFSAEFVCTAATPPPSVAPDVQYSFSLVAWLHTSPGVVRLGSQSTASITDVIASPAKRYQLHRLPASFAVAEAVICKLTALLSARRRPNNSQWRRSHRAMPGNYFTYELVGVFSPLVPRILPLHQLHVRPVSFRQYSVSR